MAIGGIVEILLGVEAAGKSLEAVARPINAVRSRTRTASRRHGRASRIYLRRAGASLRRPARSQAAAKSATSIAASGTRPPASRRTVRACLHPRRDPAGRNGPFGLPVEAYRRAARGTSSVRRQASSDAVGELRLLAVEEAVRGAVVGRRSRARRRRARAPRANCALSCAVMFWSSPACSARIGASMSAARWVGPITPLRSPGARRSRPLRSSPCPDAAASHELRPPKQNPTVKIEVQSSARRCAHCRADVLLHELRLRLLHVLHVLEVVAALRDAGGAAEVVDRDRDVAALGEAERELLVEVVEAAHVRQDHDARRRRPVGHRAKRSETIAVGRLERQVVVRDRRARDRRDRRLGVGLEAHAAETTGGGRRRAP